MLADAVKLVLHSHLESEEHFEVGWSPKFLEADDQTVAQNLRCLEIRIDGLRHDDQLYDEATQTLTQVAGYLCGGNLGKAYLVLVEDQPLPKSKVRSYKGLFPHKTRIKQGDYIEWEAELDEHQSFFMGIIPITAANKDECLSLARYFFRAFVLMVGEQTTSIYEREFLKSIIPCLDIKGSIWINYMKLIPKVCRDDLMVLSFGYHDPREEYINLRSFFHRKMESSVQKAVSLYTSSADAASAFDLV